MYTAVYCRVKKRTIVPRLRTYVGTQVILLCIHCAQSPIGTCQFPIEIPPNQLVYDEQKHFVCFFCETHKFGRTTILLSIADRTDHHLILLKTLVIRLELLRTNVSSMQSTGKVTPRIIWNYLKRLPSP